MQLSCSALLWRRDRFKFVWGYAYTLTWLKLDHEPTLDVLAKTLHLHSSQTLLIGVAMEWQTVWAGNCKQHFKVLMKNSANLSAAELDCRNASGLLWGKGTSINTAGALQANPFRTRWSCEAVRTSSGGLVPRAGRDGKSISTTATGSVGELGADSGTAAMLHQPCRRSLKTTWTSSAHRSWVSRRCLWLFQGAVCCQGHRGQNLSRSAVLPRPEPLGGECSAPVPLSPKREVGCCCLPAVGLVCS